MRYLFIAFFLVFASDIFYKYNSFSSPEKNSSSVSLVVLGTIQDAGSPQTGCTKDCCKDLFIHPDSKRKVVSLGIIDNSTGKTYLLEATPDMTAQVKLLKDFAGESAKEVPDGIFVTHAHIGHYTGLMFLGKEAANASQVTVYAMPRMKTFLEQNGPWSQLVTNKNIVINEMRENVDIQLSPQLHITPITVPHRDEFSETVGYRIEGPANKVLFIPDIDKWAKWNRNIAEEIAGVDYAFLDATFYDVAEINNRDISTIPHPFVIESMELFKSLPPAEKKKIYFIHFNHTNPLLRPESKETKQVIKEGFNVAGFLQMVEL